PRDLGPAAGVRELLRAARALALHAHRALERGLVDDEPFGREDVLGQVEREAEGVVEPERDVARERRRLPLARRLDLAREKRQAAVERLRELLLLAADDVLHAR